VQHRPFTVFQSTLDEGIGSLDPALADTPEAWQTLWNVYAPLLGYRHASGPAGATIVPVLARTLPKITDGGKTYTLNLRPGLRFSDGTPVKASDFAATVERALRMRSSTASFFLDIVGAPEYLKAPTAHVRGITTDDSTGRITIHLTRPRADFSNVLASIPAGLVPAGTQARDLSLKPPPSAGPYTIQRFQPGKQIVIVRNPHYRSLAPNVPDGNPDKVVVSLVEDDTLRMDETLGGRYDYDFPPIPFDRLPEVAKKYPDRLRVYTGANTYFFFMSPRVKPFDNIRVRKAVNYAIDRAALVQKLGGLAAPTQNILPPALPQYRKLNLYDFDVEKARQLVDDAGAKGSPVTVWSSNRPTALKASQYLVDQLNTIHLRAKLKVVEGSGYWAQIGNPRNRAGIGFANWFEDYPHPLDWFQLVSDGASLKGRGNENFGQANVPEINRLVNSLGSRAATGPAANSQWATLDRLVVDKALLAPFVNRNFTALFSGRVDPQCEVIHVVYDFDWSTACVKS